MKTNDKNELLKNIDRLKTTLNGAIRIRKNLGINTVNPVEWCKAQIKSKSSTVYKEGKNYYVKVNGYEITIYLIMLLAIGLMLNTVNRL